MSFSIIDKRDFKREVRKIIDDLSCDPCYQGGDDCCDDFRKHESDMVIHNTPSDRTRWDNKSDFSGSYNDLRDKPVIPDAANDGKTDLYYGDSLLGSWSANQVNNNNITIPEPEDANDGRTTLIYGDTAIGSWSANQVNNNNITIPEPETGNGYIRYSNGIQICWMIITPTTNVWSYFAFPKSFIELPSISLTASGWDTQKPSTVSAGGASSNTLLEVLYDGTERVYVQAIGKWK